MTDVGLAALTRHFAETCMTFVQVQARAEDAIDGVDFTGHLHELSFLAGRVLALGEALMLVTGDVVWQQQANETVQEYLPSLPPPSTYQPLH